MLTTFCMEEIIREFLQDAGRVPAFSLFLVMLAGAFLEYVFPPFPGDFCVAGGALLMVEGQSFWTVFLGVNLGSFLGGVVTGATSSAVSGMPTYAGGGGSTRTLEKKRGISRHSEYLFLGTGGMVEE